MSELDARLFRMLHEALSSGSVVLFAMAALTVLGSGWSMLLLLPLVARPRTRPSAVALAATLGGTSLLVFFVKQLARRPRPCVGLPGVRALVFDAPQDFSFPSGHAAGSFAFAGFVAVLLLARERTPRRWLAAAAALAVAAGVALSRVALGVHFPGDVVAGAAVGLVSGALGASVHVRRPGKELEHNRAL